jgi:hypothetical protein
MRAILFLSAVLISLWPAAADAQVFGTFTWQMQPYCNRVTLMLATSPGGFSVSGVDDQCGAVSKGSATGVAVFNGDGSVGLNFTIVTPPSGVAVHVSATVSPATGLGTWSDDVGNTGTLALHGNVSGLPARPTTMTPLSVAENPNEATDPCASAVAPATMVLCGTATYRWSNGGFGLGALQVWRDRNGQVHIRGSARRIGTGIGGAVFILPPAYAPKRTLAMTVSTGVSAGVHTGGTALLVVYGPDVPGATGYVAIYSASDPAHTVIHVGEAIYSVDR